MLTSNIDLIYSALLACVGGVIREIKRKNGDKSFIKFISEAGVSGFVGIITFLTFSEYLSGNMLAAITGMSGYLSTPFLDVVGSVIKGKLKLKLEK